MRIILDEGVPKEVARGLAGHEVVTVPDAGWASVKNGKLLALIESAGFSAFVTCDHCCPKQDRVGPGAVEGKGLESVETGISDGGLSFSRVAACPNHARARVSC